MDFSIPPYELQRRRNRCHPIAQQVLNLGTEQIQTCNVCGSEQAMILAHTDRYGLPLRTVMCLNCGLIYQMDRLTEEGYAEFYGGYYRRLLSAFSPLSRPVSNEQRVKNAITYADMVMNYLGRTKSLKHASSLLDVGGSVGSVAEVFGRELNAEATVIDPSPDEIAVARQRGLNTAVGTIETWDTEDRFDLILLCRSIEHLYDLRRGFEKIRRLLSPDGVFFVDFLDFVELCRQQGAPEAVAKIDHCYWLTFDAAFPIMRSLGFEAIQTFWVATLNIVGFLLKPCEATNDFDLAGSPIQKQIHQLHTINADWFEMGPPVSDIFPWLRVRGHSIKKSVKRSLRR